MAPSGAIEPLEEPEDEPPASALPPPTHRLHVYEVVPAPASRVESLSPRPGGRRISLPAIAPGCPRRSPPGGILFPASPRGVARVTTCYWPGHRVLPSPGHPGRRVPEKGFEP
jgi:hypothetical protein